MSHRTALIALAAVVSFPIPTSGQPQGKATGANARVDAFSKVHCGADVAKALVGGTMPNKPSGSLVAAHADIKLADVGGSEIADDLFLGGWQMCGHEYQLLLHRDRIDDALQFPSHSRRQPAFLGACSLNGRRVDHVLAVLDNPAPRAKGQPSYAPDDTASLAAVAAWRIDAGNRRMSSMPPGGLRCPRGGIFTVDGGT
jgi:hypothetical protein